MQFLVRKSFPKLDPSNKHIAVTILCKGLVDEEEAKRAAEQSEAKLAKTMKSRGCDNIFSAVSCSQVPIPMVHFKRQSVSLQCADDEGGEHQLGWEGESMQKCDEVADRAKGVGMLFGDGKWHSPTWNLSRCNVWLPRLTASRSAWQRRNAESWE